MNSIRRMLKRARESDTGSREQYSFESSALWNIRGMVDFWADEYTLRGDKLSLIHISETTRLGMMSYAVFCLKK